MHPSPPPNPADLPQPLVLFLTARERKEALRALRRIHPDRAAALRIALQRAQRAEGRAP